MAAPREKNRVGWYTSGISNVQRRLIAFSTIRELQNRRKIRVTFTSTQSGKYHQIYSAYVFATVTDNASDVSVDFWTKEEHDDIVVVAVDSDNKYTDYSREIFPTTPRNERRHFIWQIEGTTPWLTWLNFFKGDSVAGSVDYSNPMNLLPVLMSGSYGSDVPEGAESDWISDPVADGIYSTGIKILDQAANLSVQTEERFVSVTAYPRVPTLLQVVGYNAGSDLLSLSWNTGVFARDLTRS